LSLVNGITVAEILYAFGAGGISKSLTVLAKKLPPVADRFVLMVYQSLNAGRSPCVVLLFSLFVGGLGSTAIAKRLA